MKKFFPIIIITLFVVEFLVSASPYFDIQLKGVKKDIGTWQMEEPELNSDEITHIKLGISNYGDDGTMRIECGIYKRSTVNGWYGKDVYSLSILTPALNCQEYETNVKTWILTLNKGESKELVFDVKSPVVKGLSGYSEDYGVHCQTYIRCWQPGVDIGRTDYDVLPVRIRKSEIYSPETCSDGIKNQDETDTDCGGVCKGCKELLSCTDDSDCGDNLVCKKSSNVHLTKQCAKSDTPYVWLEPDVTPPNTCGNGKLDSGETCVNCPSDLSNCKKPFVTQKSFRLIYVLVGIGVGSLGFFGGPVFGFGGMVIGGIMGTVIMLLV